MAKEPAEQINPSEAVPEGIRPGRYRHFKGGEYEVMYVAKHSETMEPGSLRGRRRLGAPGVHVE
jgi:hypothetical protein